MAAQVAQRERGVAHGGDVITHIAHIARGFAAREGRRS